MKHRHHITITLSLLLILGSAASVPAAENVTRLGRYSNQRDFSAIARPIHSQVLDPRFVTRDAMYLANEQILSAFRFFERAHAAGMPIAEDMDFFNMTTVESYWYSRYNLSWLVSKSRMGIGLVHSPYLTLKAEEQEDRVFYSRDRGERPPANREILLRQLIPTYLARTGFARRFEDATPLMLEFASGDPTLTRPLDVNDDFEGGNGKIDYEDTYLTLRWSHDAMDKTIDLGGVGQTLWKQVLWAEYFFKGRHGEGSKLLGNDSEEGFRGSMLTLMAVSKMLALKSALFFDGQRLTGVHPFEYDPRERLLYLPHRVRPELIQAGDIPPRPQWYTVKDPSSRLFDQASLLLGFTQYVNYSDPEAYVHYSDPEQAYPYEGVFGDDFPYDGSIMEQKWTLLARGLAQVILKNIDYMHRAGEEGDLVSTYLPDKGSSSDVEIADAGLTMVALASYLTHVRGDEALRQVAEQILRQEADFLLRVQPADGGFAASYDVVSKRPVEQRKTLQAQGLAVRGLLQAHHLLGDSRYLDGAQDTYDFMNRVLWHDGVGVYRSEEGAAVSTYTPSDLAAALGAVREMALATKDMAEIERYKTLHVQSINRSGILLAEENETGEVDLAILDDTGDGDGDGIPHFSKAGGKYGRAAVYAARISIETP